ncbi:hypothetical protein ILUMI_21623 [Ignelater luminosus]|uniref:Uncharacterized protein n=1 Tax=Ignelater luminosus TaxID=2038154 RepID=A0A8K0CG27_IGNLU|nr:hypothetical protein ILUMI_21623 [Ignelater luminosus]
MTGLVSPEDIRSYSKGQARKESNQVRSEGSVHSENSKIDWAGESSEMEEPEEGNIDLSSLNVGDWVGLLQTGKLHILDRELEGYGFDITGISERPRTPHNHKWKVDDLLG